MENKELITIEQLPVIRQRFEELSANIKSEVAYALSLECNEETYKDIKKVRASLNADKKELDAKRIAVKKAVMQPYEQFESIYKELVGNIYSEADSSLCAKISSVEDELKTVKTDKARKYFDEYASVFGVTELLFDDIGLKINLSDSDNKIKNAINDAVGQFVEDLNTIDIMDNSSEIRIEYMNNGRNLSLAIRTVNDRIAQLKAYEERKKLEEEKKRIESDMESKVETIVNSAIEESDSIDDEEVVYPDDKYTVSFRVTASKKQLKQLVDLMRKEEIIYEQF